MEKNELKQARCIFDGRKYIIIERAGNTVRIENADGQLIVGIEHIRPTNKEGRAVCG